MSMSLVPFVCFQCVLGPLGVFYVPRVCELRCVSVFACFECVLETMRDYVVV